MRLQEFDVHRRTAATANGPVSYVETGAGERVALFVHGVGTASYLWRNVIEELGPAYRCVALDLPLHGHTPGRPGMPFTLASFAAVVNDLCAALDLPPVNLVGNDTGGAVCQTVAVTYPQRIRTLTLTNCDTHDNFPPESFKPTVELAAAGVIQQAAPGILASVEAMRATSLGNSYEHPETVTEEVYRAYLEPVMGTTERAAEFERLLVALDAAELLAIEDKLKNLETPTLVAWGTGDPLFELSWAYWLRDTIPGVTRVVEVPGGNLFYPEERPEELARPLREFWAAQS